MLFKASERYSNCHQAWIERVKLINICAGTDRFKWCQTVQQRTLTFYSRIYNPKTEKPRYNM